MTCLQIAATSLQCIGVLVTAWGLLHAWNRASRRFDEWVNGLTATLKQLRSRVTYTGDAAAEITPKARGHGGLTAPAAAVDVPNRLLNIEKRLDDLPDQIDIKIQAVEAAVDQKLAALDETGKAFAVKDIYWALRGIAVQVLGYALSLYAQLSS